MKRMWIGIGILIFLLAVGTVMLFASQSFFSDFAENLEEAGELALEENWSAALEKAEESRLQWQKYRRFWAASTDHEPVEEMQNLFSQLQVYARGRMKVDFSTICRHLAHLAEAIDESHNLRWWSVL